MNYLPFCGYWFYGGVDATETAAFYSSWGLLGTVPAIGFVIQRFWMYYEMMRRQ